MNSQVEEGSVSGNQEDKEEKRTFSWKIVVSSVLVGVGVAFAIIYAYASGYFGGPAKLALNSKTSVPNFKDSLPLDGILEERFFFVKSNGNKLISFSTENSEPVEHDNKKSGIKYLKFSTSCKYESNNKPMIVSLGWNSDNLRKLVLYNYETRKSDIINFDTKNYGKFDYVSLSLNEDKIAASAGSNIWIANINGTDSKKLTIASSIYPQPQFALNDSVILYNTETINYKSIIQSFDLETRGKKCFYEGKENILNFLVSPDGNKIVVHTASKLEIIDLTNENGDKISWNNEQIKIEELLKWSKNGSEIFYKDSGNNLWKLKLNPKNGENQNEQVKDKTGKPFKF